jgi:hypothetical protein
MNKSVVPNIDWQLIVLIAEKLADLRAQSPEAHKSPQYKAARNLLVDLVTHGK